ncbi:hypothetical protein [Ottowia sp.]|uniref:hypothetical protein n=1 Tax=Ottowia sp. TaxID=1898956 RepID=UPI003A859365
MKFFAILVLPKDTDVAHTEMVEDAASKMMQPFKMWEEGDTVDGAGFPLEGDGYWDYYSCCSKDCMAHREAEGRFGYSAYAGVPENQPLVVFPVEQVGGEGVTDSIVTPDGQWHRSQASYTQDDSSWEAKALGICQSYSGYFGVLLFCHG